MYFYRENRLLKMSVKVLARKIPRNFPGSAPRRFLRGARGGENWNKFSRRGTGKTVTRSKTFPPSAHY